MLSFDLISLNRLLLPVLDVLTIIHEFLVIFAKIVKHSFAFTTFTTYKKVKVDYYLLFRYDVSK